MTLPVLLQMRRDLDHAASYASLLQEQTPWSFVLRHRRLVFHIARRFAGYGFSPEELVQEGLLGLYHAAKSWKEERGVAFSTWGGKLTQQAIWAYIKQQRQIIPATSLDEPASDSREDDEQTVGDLLEDSGKDEQVRELFHNQELLAQLLAVLTPDERVIICLQFGLNSEQKECSQREIQRRTGRDPRAIRRIEQRAMCRMRSVAVRRLGMTISEEAMT